MMAKGKRVLVVSLWVLLLSCNEVESASLILDPPVDQTVPVNSTAVFSCRVKGFLVWEIDTLEISDSRRDAFCIDRGVCVNGTLDSSPDETESVLLVAANELNNGSTIRCLASETIVSPSEASEAAVLTTFDRPAPPTHLLSSPVSHLHLNISWSAPFLFPGTQMSYTITIRNVNTSEEIQREGLEVTHFIFNGTGGGSVCDVYQFSVAAVNSAGSSDQSETSSHSLPTLPIITGSIASIYSDVTLGNGLASLFISFETAYLLRTKKSWAVEPGNEAIPAQSCQGYPVTNHSIVLQNSSADDTTVFGPFSPSENGRVQVELENFAENAQYSFRVTAENSVGSTTSNKTQFFTTDVQNASVSRSDRDEDSVIITCRFAEGSQALGCHVELRIQSSLNVMFSQDIPIQSLEATSGIITLAYPLSYYDICAFDWESDGTRGELCVPVRVNESLSGTEDCGNGPSPAAGSSTPIWIVAPIVVGVLLLITTVALVGVCICKQSRKPSSHNYPKDIDLNDNVAYGPVAPTAAVYEEVSDHPEKIEMSGNVAYGQFSH